MAKLSKDSGAGLGATLHPRENQFIAGNLGSLNAELDLGADGSASVGVVITGAYVGTVIIEGSYDGTNWDSVPVRTVSAGSIYLLTLASAAVGRWVGPCQGFKQLRARMSAWSSGVAAVSLVASNAPIEMLMLPKSADLSVTVTAATGVAATLTIPAGGAGLFHNFARILIQRHTSALLTAGVTPLLVTTTNLPGARVFSLPADAAAQGVVAPEIVEPTVPLRCSAANTTTTFIAPATTGVIWRMTVDYFLAPHA